MLNTEDELGQYPAAIDRLLDRVCDEYGLVIAGWSAAFDTALRAAIERSASRRFATYWVNPGEPNELARRVIAQRRAEIALQPADGFFVDLGAAVEALRVIARRHPESIDAEVLAAKRDLGSGRIPVRLHDTIRRELERLARSPETAAQSFTGAPTTFVPQRDQLLADLEMPLALVATLAYWGNSATDAWWFEEVSRLSAHPEGASGDTSLIELKRYPGVAIGYIAGVAAMAKGRWDLIAELLEVKTTDPYRGERRPILLMAPPGNWLCEPTSEHRTFDLAKIAVAERLGLGEHPFVDAWERWEYALLVAGEERGQGANVYCRRVRAEGTVAREYFPVPSEWWHEEFARLGDRHPSIVAGVFPSADRALKAADAVDDIFVKVARAGAFRQLPGGGGFLPSTRHYSAGG